MEVHHHAHTPDSHRDKKKWTHYFWEFLMLFLAVFCGFFSGEPTGAYNRTQKGKEIPGKPVPGSKEGFGYHPGRIKIS